jgi:TonB family protein
MFLSAVLAASAAAIMGVSTPALADGTLTWGSMMTADLGRDVDAVSAAEQTEAKIVRAASAEMPAIERLEHVGGTSTIQIDLNSKGIVTTAAVRTSSGRARLDRSALSAVRASTYQAASVNGRAVGGRYIVEVTFDPAN